MLGAVRRYAVLLVLAMVLVGCRIVQPSVRYPDDLDPLTCCRSAPSSGR